MEVVDDVPIVSAGLNKYASDSVSHGSSEILNSMTIWGGDAACPSVFVVAPFKEE